MKSIVEMGRSDVSGELIEAYRSEGVVKVPNLISTGCAAEIRKEAVTVAGGETTFGDDAYSARLTQQVNVWRTNEVLKQLTMCPGIAVIAEKLTVCEMRLWHDHLLSKAPKNGLATEWHQDRPYWPFEGKPETISAWIALQDTPCELGCMSFIPGSHEMDDLPEQNLGDAGSLFSIAPELEYAPKVTMPLKAGDATFHNGRMAHMATANQTEEWRIAHVIIYMQKGTRYSGRPHVVTGDYKHEGGELQPGDELTQEWFPCVADTQ